MKKEVSWLIWICFKYPKLPQFSKNLQVTPWISIILWRDKGRGVLENIETFLKFRVIFNNVHPLLHSPTSKIHQDPETQLWSRGYEIHHSGIWGLDQRTWRKGRSSNRIPIRVWTRNVETRSWSQERDQRERMVSKRYSRSFPNLVSEEWRFRCRIEI